MNSQINEKMHLFLPSNFNVRVWANSTFSAALLNPENISTSTYYPAVSTYEPPRDKTNKMTVLPAKTQISLGTRPVWSASSPCAQWVANDSSFLHADSEDSDQTGRMPRLIWVFAGRTAILLLLSCRGSYSCCTHQRGNKNLRKIHFGAHMVLKRIPTYMYTKSLKQFTNS